MGRGGYLGGSTIIRFFTKPKRRRPTKLGALQIAAAEYDPSKAEPQLLRKEDKPERRSLPPEVAECRKQKQLENKQARARKGNAREAALAKLESKRNRRKGRKGYPEKP